MTPFMLENQRIYGEYGDCRSASLPELSLALLARQKLNWPLLQAAYASLEATRERRVEVGDLAVWLQHNPQRIISSGANIDPIAIKARPCFLCMQNLPVVQEAIVYHNQFLILCNPFPILKAHFTIVHLEHLPQLLSRALPSFLQLAHDFQPHFALLYNGPQCGASAPDHLHFQALPQVGIPVLRDGAGRKKKVWEGEGIILFKTTQTIRPTLIVEGNDLHRLADYLDRIIRSMQRSFAGSQAPQKPKEPQELNEPMMNLFCHYVGDKWRIIIFPRRQHRPEAYFKTGDERILVSPGAVDMGGLLVLPREEDFDHLDAAMLLNIFREVSLSDELVDRITAGI